MLRRPVLLLLLLTLLFPATQAGAQRVGSATFTTPPGWTVSVEGQMATFTPAGGAAQGLMLLLPDQAVSGDAEAWFGATVRALSSDGQVIDRSKVTTAKTASGTPLLVQAVTVKLAQGAQHRFYTAVLSGGRATLAVLVAPGTDALKGLQPGLITLVNSMQPPGQLASSGPAAPGLLTGEKVALPAVRPMNAAQFVAAGGDPQSAVIPDEFRCYQEKRGSGLTPELTVQILPGGQYRTPHGAGSFSVQKDGSLRKTAWRGGPLDGASGYLNFGDHGQTLSLSNVGEDVLEDELSFECYQRGPREKLTLLEFKLKTPAPAAYPCVLPSGSGRSGGTLEILPGGAYRLGGQSGRYSVDFRSDQDEAWSDLAFTGGPLDDASGTYSQDENGVRELRVYRPEIRCRNVTTPTPLPRHGTAKAPAPPRGSGGLSGAYATWYTDPLAILGYGGCSGLCWNTRFFTKEGYVYTREPDHSLSEADCSRTHPNGLPVCEVYRVQGGKITIGEDEPETFKKEGQNLKIGSRTYEPMLPLAGVKLGGEYESQSFIGGGAGSTTSGSFERTLVFTPQGRFSRASSGGISSTFTDTGTSLGNVTGGVTVTSQDGSSGTYRFTGYTLELTYGDRHVERKFAFTLPDKNGKPDLGLLRIAGSSYTRRGGK